jgi:hypothetical protein
VDKALNDLGLILLGDVLGDDFGEVVFEVFGKEDFGGCHCVACEGAGGVSRVGVCWEILAFDLFASGDLGQVFDGFFEADLTSFADTVGAASGTSTVSGDASMVEGAPSWTGHEGRHLVIFHGFLQRKIRTPGNRFKTAFGTPGTTALKITSGPPPVRAPSDVCHSRVAWLWRQGEQAFERY